MTTNRERALLAEQALLEFMRHSGFTPADSPLTCLADLLADLRHYADMLGLRWQDVLDGSELHYMAEAGLQLDGFTDPDDSRLKPDIDNTVFANWSS